MSVKIPKTANSECKNYVLACDEFNGASNEHSRNGYSIAGRRIGYMYVVYSYGYWPMYVCDTRNDVWFVNAHKFSVTTSKQASMSYPTGKDCMPLPTDELNDMLHRARMWKDEA
jgi:hypothetical protein